MKRVLIKGFYGNDNLGDDFILYSLLDTISSAGSFKVTVIYNEKKNYDELFSKYSDLKCRYLHGSHKRILSKLLSLLVCDYWIIGGGGLFPSEKNAEISKLYRQIRLARIFKTKV